MFKHWALFFEWESGTVMPAQRHRYFWTKRGAERYGQHVQKLLNKWGFDHINVTVKTRKVND